MFKTGYAGFWIRFGAALIDHFVFILFSVFTFSLFFSAMIYFELLSISDLRIAGLMFLVGVLPGLRWLYYALQYSSKHSATFGMRTAGFKVLDSNYQPLSFMKASIRYFSAVFSYIFALGFLMIATSKRKQALHDRVADTVTVYDPEATK